MKKHPSDRTLIDAALDRAAAMFLGQQLPPGAELELRFVRTALEAGDVTLDEITAEFARRVSERLRS